jgi:hypothetical protein
VCRANYCRQRQHAWPPSSAVAIRADSAACCNVTRLTDASSAPSRLSAHQFPHPLLTFSTLPAPSCHPARSLPGDTCHQ